MKVAAVVCSILAASASAFAPAAVQKSSTALHMEVDRRAAFGQLVVGATVAAGLPQLAAADGAVSGATIARSRAIYGGRIFALKPAVDKGDFEAVADAKNAFVLFNSGAYPAAKDKTKKKDAVADTNAIFKAVRDGDKGALQSAYKSYVAKNNIKDIPKVNRKEGQGYSSDYDYRVRTPAASLRSL